MSTKEHKGFNLLRDQLQEADKWDKIQNWVNGTARIIVIAVEFIVIVCFGARIYMDRVARNLETRLEENMVQLDSLEDTEARIRQLQIDLQNYKGLWEATSGYSNHVDEVYAYIPEISNSISVSMDSGTLSINGTASTSNIGKLEGIIKSSEKYQDTLLERYTPEGLSENIDTQGQFSLRTNLVDYKRELAGSAEENDQPSPATIPDLE